jgi:hypothetical protein
VEFSWWQKEANTFPIRDSYENVGKMEKEAVIHTVIKKEIQPVNAQVYCSN